MSEFNENQDFPDYWHMLENDFDLGQIKDNIKAVMSGDESGKEFKSWISERAEGLLKCYMYGLTHGVKLAARMCIDDFTLFIYIIEKTKMKKKEELKPEPMRPPETELNKLFDDNKIQDEIDNMLRGEE